jgi:hypothetical protein
MVESRSRFMAIYGMAASIAFIVVIIALAIPNCGHFADRLQPQ